MSAVAELSNEKSSVDIAVHSRAAVQDCLFLGLIVLLSLILYVARLGFYSDDWIFLSLLNMSSDQSPPGLYQALYAGDVVIRQRPVQMVYLVLLYWLFGLHPLGYHLANAIVLVASTILFYLVMRELRQSRLLALTIPLVYALLPHYSTDRFWLAAFQATLSIAFYFLSLYADLRAIREYPMRLGRWKVLSAVSLLTSSLAYEVTLPLFLLNPLLVWYAARQLYSVEAGNRLVRSRAAVLFGSNLLALLLVVAFKALVTVRTNVGVDLLSHIAYLATGAVRVNYGTYGLGLPYVLVWILGHRPDLAVIAAGAIVGAAVFAYLYRLAGGAQMPGRSSWLRLMATGFAIFVLGYSIFVTTADVWFTSASLGNRIAIAASMGVAVSYVGALGWLNSFLPLERWRRSAFCLLVALLCGTGFLINNTLATFWIEAYREQRAILDDIREHVPALPAQSILILDGVCLEHGGAYIFTGKRDLAALLIMSYQDQSLWATAITNPAKIGEERLSIFTFRDDDHYPYGEKLLIYNFEQKKVYQLTDSEAAHRYFERADFDPGRDCPPGFAWRWNSQ